jgi:hypothetical protein
LEHLIRGPIERVLALFVGGLGLGMVVAEHEYDLDGNA